MRDLESADARKTRKGPPTFWNQGNVDGPFRRALVLSGVPINQQSRMRVAI